MIYLRWLSSTQEGNFKFSRPNLIELDELSTHVNSDYHRSIHNGYIENLPRLENYHDTNEISTLRGQHNEVWLYDGILIVHIQISVTFVLVPIWTNENVWFVISCCSYWREVTSTMILFNLTKNTLIFFLVNEKTTY